MAKKNVTVHMDNGQVKEINVDGQTINVGELVRGLGGAVNAGKLTLAVVLPDGTTANYDGLRDAQKTIPAGATAYATPKNVGGARS